MTSLARRNGQLNPSVRLGSRNPDWMLQQLPIGLLDDDEARRADPTRANFFVRFVSIFQELGDSLFEDADNIEHLLDSSVTPTRVLRWLGSWIGLDEIDSKLDDITQRRLVAGAAEALIWRGTRRGLSSFLGIISNGPVEVVDGGGIWSEDDAPADTAWVRMTVASTGQLKDEEFIEFVRDEVPAHVRAELYVGDRLIWSSEGERP